MHVRNTMSMGVRRVMVLFSRAMFSMVCMRVSMAMGVAMRMATLLNCQRYLSMDDRPTHMHMPSHRKHSKQIDGESKRAHKEQLTCVHVGRVHAAETEVRRKLSFLERAASSQPFYRLEDDEDRNQDQKHSV